MAQPQSQPQLDIGRKAKTLKDIALPQSYQIAPMKGARVAPLIPYTLYLIPYTLALTLNRFIAVV